MLKTSPKSQFLNSDCMKHLPDFADNHFDLAMVDPPYGVGVAKWDVKPKQDYFDQLFRVSKKQIVFGGIYFNLPITQGWLCWDKTFAEAILETNLGYGVENRSEFELIWTSFLDKSRFIRYTDVGNIRGFNGKLRVNYKQNHAIHPTQKTAHLYRWLLKNYAKPGDLIIDTHVGSGSSLVACIIEGFDYIGYEIDKEYYDGAMKRIKAEQQKITLF